ncbi:hypothetical protein KPH14_011445 [Odynerus spinipes]|uniref:Uncharacterized protein n=1 Tax=Odynerus spinipes TaxID=1348599 RepID=A0AAD9RV68_9HYME|nr:hypothetical protein KPH14_011445 [Odynerus spinipes]
MNVKGNPQKKSNKELSVAMIPKIMSEMTPTKSTDNVLVNPVNILVKSEEELGISSTKTAQTNSYKNRDISDSSIQSTVDQIGSCDTSILYKPNTSDTDIQDLKPDLELYQSDADSHKISNSDNVSNLKIEDVVSCSDIHPLPQNEMTNQQKPTNSIITPATQPRRRGRPRKCVSIQTPEECNNYCPQSHVSNSEMSTYSTKHSMETPTIAADSKALNSNIKIDTVKSDHTPKRRGRPPSKNKIIKNEIKNHDKKDTNVDTINTEHMPQLSNLSIVSNENSRLNVEQDTMQPVKCARCGKEVINKLWAAHNLAKHNNMSWYEGEEPMDFQNDTKLLKRVLANAIKKKKGQLSCEQCGAIKRSVNGFISHIQFCGKSDDEKRALMVTCPVCNAVMMPSSMEIHERHHRELKYSKRKSFILESTEHEKVRRKAAEKAVSKILQFTELVKEECIGQTKKVELNSSVLAAETAPNTSTKCEDTLDDTNDTSNVTGIVCQENRSFETEPHPLKVKKPKNEGDSFTKIENTLPSTEDQYDTFGSYVASEIRCLNSDYLRRKLKRKIQCAIIDIQDEEDRLPGSTTPESSFT